MKKALVLAVLAATSGSAMADTITGAYVGGGPPLAAIFNYPGASNAQGGALGHTWSGGTGVLSLYNGTHLSFCSDAQTVSGANNTFTLNAVTAAPINPSGNPGEGTSYSSTEAVRLNAWMKAARILNIVDSRGFFNNLGQLGYTNQELSLAMQFGVWDSLWDDAVQTPWSEATGEVSIIAGQTTVANAIAMIRAVALTQLSASMDTRILTSDQGQDQVVIVPLPPAAWAGLGSLTCVIGAGYIRRRGQRA